MSSSGTPTRFFVLCLQLSLALLHSLRTLDRLHCLFGVDALERVVADHVELLEFLIDQLVVDNIFLVVDDDLQVLILLIGLREIGSVLVTTSRLEGWIHLRDFCPLKPCEEGMALHFFDAFGAKSLLWIRDEKLIYKVMGLWRHHALFSANWRVLNVTSLDSLEDLEGRIGLEGQTSSQELVDNDSKRPEIKRFSVFLTVNYLWCHVMASTKCTICLLGLFGMIGTLLFIRASST